MKMAWMIARRYVRPTKLNVITVIGAISVLGIVIGTAALVIVTSLFNGFRGVAHDLMIGFGPHLTVLPTQGIGLEKPDGTATALKEVLQQHIGSADVALVATSKLVVNIRGRTGVANGIALTNPMSPVHNGLRSSVSTGSYVFSDHGTSTVVISLSLADQLNIRPGDTISLISPESIQRALSVMSMPQGYGVVVAGIFQANAVHDGGVGSLYCSTEVFDRVVGKKQNNILYATVSQPRVLPKKRNEIEQALTSAVGSSTSVQVRTWEDANRSLVDTMRMESVGSFIVLALIVVVASFNVLVSLTLGVVEKCRDIAVLQGMGLTTADIRRIYLLQGSIIGIVSVVAGLCVGLLICWGQLTFHWIAFDMASGFLVPYLPLEVHLLDVVVIGVVGLALVSVSALYPASRAAGTTIAEAIRVD